MLQQQFARWGKGTNDWRSRIAAKHENNDGRKDSEQEEKKEWGSELKSQHAEEGDICSGWVKIYEEQMSEWQKCPSVVILFFCDQWNVANQERNGPQ